MENALGESQTIVLLGGSSDIGRAIVSELLTTSTRSVVLAARRPDEVVVGELARPGLDVAIVAFDATDSASHEDFVKGLAAEHGDLDVVIMAFGQLAEQSDLDDDPGRSH